jgi:hypothetical protein
MLSFYSIHHPSRRSAGNLCRAANSMPADRRPVPRRTALRIPVRTIPAFAPYAFSRPSAAIRMPYFVLIDPETSQRYELLRFFHYLGHCNISVPEPNEP